MRRKESLHRQVYDSIFPSPDKKNDPSSWNQFLRFQIIPEVRCEALMFYGEGNSLESRYPGLDYAYAPHRHRLSRHPAHSKLFQAFDRLDLTSSEIYKMCNWEGTLFAKEKYEAEHKITIRDTTGDEVPEYFEPPVNDDEETPEEGEIQEGENEEGEMLSDAKSEMDTDDEQEGQEDLSATFDQEGPRIASGAVHPPSAAVIRANRLSMTAALVRS